MKFEIVRGTAASLHATEPGERPEFAASWNLVTRPALVLGSTQSISTVDEAGARALGIELVHRRSGGGSVLMLPGEMAWLDVVVPRDDPRWSDDVGQAMWWLGEVWVQALAACGIDGVVHHGSLEGGDLARLVCFAGRGAGEVLSVEQPGEAAAKLVGISQRRTRFAARLQSSMHFVWRPDLVASLIVDDGVTADRLAPLVRAADVDAELLRAALGSALARS